MDIRNCIIMYQPDMDYDFQFREIKELAEKTKEQTRKAIKQENVLRLAIQDRILGTIDDEELSKISKESDRIAGECTSTRMKLYGWCKLFYDIREELMRLVNNAGYATAELDTTVNNARIFSDIGKITKEETE